MTLRFFIKSWFLATLFMAYEAWALNWAPGYSILKHLRDFHMISSRFDLSPKPGFTISLWLGWLGIGMMLLTNLYVLRKRLSFLRSSGSLERWLDFHIFAGLLGPTFILFHSNFEVHGLVAMSFWSMVIVFMSGIIGRYFYLQTLRQKSDLESSLRYWEAKIKSFGSSTNMESMKRSKALVLALAQVPEDNEKTLPSIIGAMVSCVKSDVRLKLGMDRFMRGVSPSLQEAVQEYAVFRRKLVFLEQFRRLTGYWHAFHVAFSLLMFIFAAIHIGAVLMFQI